LKEAISVALFPHQWPLIDAWHKTYHRYTKFGKMHIIDFAETNADMKALIMEAMTGFDDTCIRFVPRTKESQNYLMIVAGMGWVALFYNMLWPVPADA
jgi:hypothetical protein